MRSCIPIRIAIACFFVGTTAIAEDKDASPVDVAKLINSLASENPAPKKRSGPSLKYPAGYDQTKQDPVRNARYELKALGPVAFKELIEHWEDERYCQTYSIGINGYMYNATVGKMCRIIVYDQIQPYGIWPITDDDPRGKPRRPSYPSVFLNEAKDAEKWVEANKEKSFYEIQLMVVDWVIARESENPKDFTDEEREFMTETRKKLIENKNPLTKGNYYMDDYN